MTNLVIKIIAVEQQTAKASTGKDYELVEVTYKNKSFQDKVEVKKHNQYGNKDVFNALKKAEPGEVYTVSREKDAKGYWQWVGITEGEDAQPAASQAPSKATIATPAPKSTYETPEERAKKQVYIVRQSSITAAITILKTDKKNPTVDEVLDIAKKFENYVFGIDIKQPVDIEIPEMDDDDIPM